MSGTQAIKYKVNYHLGTVDIQSKNVWDDPETLTIYSRKVVRDMTGVVTETTEWTPGLSLKNASCVRHLVDTPYPYASRPWWKFWG